MELAQDEGRRDGERWREQLEDAQEEYQAIVQVMSRGCFILHTKSQSTISFKIPEVLLYQSSFALSVEKLQSVGLTQHSSTIAASIISLACFCQFLEPCCSASQSFCKQACACGGLIQAIQHYNRSTCWVSS